MNVYLKKVKYENGDCKKCYFVNGIVCLKYDKDCSGIYYKQIFPKRVKIVKDKTINTCGSECYFKDKKCPWHSIVNNCRENKFHYELIK